MRVTFATAAAAAALAVLVSACGSTTPTLQSSDLAPGAEVSATSAPTSAAPTSAPANEPSEPATGGMSVDEFLAKATKAQGQVKTYAMEMTTSALDAEGMSATGVVDQSGGTMNQHMKMDFMGQEMEMILLDQTVYMLMPAMGKDWYRMTPEQAQTSGFEMPSAPGDMLNEARDAFEKVEFLGQEDILGASTEHYRLTLVPDGADDGGLGIPQYDVWLDELGFTRKVLVEITGDESATRIEMLTDKINEPVTIKAPEKWVDMPS